MRKLDPSSGRHECVNVNGRIRQFILDLDERDYIDFLYPRNLRSVRLKHEEMLENLKDIDETLCDMESGKIKIQ